MPPFFNPSSPNWSYTLRFSGSLSTSYASETSLNFSVAACLSPLARSCKAAGLVQCWKQNTVVSLQRVMGVTAFQNKADKQAARAMRSSSGSAVLCLKQNTYWVPLHSQLPVCCSKYTMSVEHVVHSFVVEINCCNHAAAHHCH